MMAGPIILAALLTGSSRSLLASVLYRSTTRTASTSLTKRSLASSSSSSTNSPVSAEQKISRFSTLQTLLSWHGAPGSRNLDLRHPHRLVAVQSIHETPELIATLTGGNDYDSELASLHPYLYPIAKQAAKTSDPYYICAYRNPYLELETHSTTPWPIVETSLDGPGFQLLALNSEHLMRRIVCELDGGTGTTAEDKDSSIRLYNEGLGLGLLNDKALDTPYEPGSVSKLGYGVEKYVLLRVGPFCDLYEQMAQNHAAKNDEQSSLIAAEAANTKLRGFASTFRFYAELLRSFPNREEEARDAARMCLQLPLPTIGLKRQDFQQVAVLGLIADQNDSLDVAMEKLNDMYLKIHDLDKEEDANKSKTLNQIAVDEANRIIDLAVLNGTPFKEIRQDVADKFRKAGLTDMANFVDFSKSL